MEEENEFVLPGAVGSNQGKSKPLQEKELAEEDDSTLLEKVQEIPSALIDAATGEGQETNRWPADSWCTQYSVMWFAIILEAGV